MRVAYIGCCIYSLIQRAKLTLPVRLPMHRPTMYISDMVLSLSLSLSMSLSLSLCLSLSLSFSVLTAIFRVNLG